MQKIAKDTILIGHALHHDLRMLKISHHIVIDTSKVYKRDTGQARGLKELAQTELGEHIQSNRQAHSPAVDAEICIKLMKKKISPELEIGGDLGTELSEHSGQEIQFINQMRDIFLHQFFFALKIISFFTPNFWFVLHLFFHQYFCFFTVNILLFLHQILKFRKRFWV